MTRPDDVDPLAALEAQLRTDALAWGSGLPPAARQRLRQRLRRAHATHSRSTRALVTVLAAALLLALGAWFWATSARTHAPARSRAISVEVARLDVGHLGTLATTPLRNELANIVNDGRAVVRGVWLQMPSPLRRLLGS
ncbi:MAG: hypothetical protein R3F56_21280 [Planctomycetota bacterium]